MPFIGLTTVEHSGENTTVLRLDLRYNFYGNHYLTAMYNMVAYPGNLAYADATLSDVFDFDLQGAGLKYSYDSPIGPISLTAHWSNTYIGSLFGAYFSFGYTF
jgi:hypothetical protein